MKNQKIIHLDITSFSGVSIGASHFYGKLVQSNPYTSVELFRTLTSKDAKKMNRKDDWDGYRAGMTTERFDSKDEIISLAVQTYKTHFPDAEILLLGDSASWKPKKVLASPDSVMVPANEIWEKYAAIPWEYKYGFYDLSLANRKLADNLTIEWEHILFGVKNEN